MPNALLSDTPLPVETPEPGSEARAELLSQLKAPLDPEIEATLARTIAADVAAAAQDRRDWETNLDVDEKQYHGILPDKTWPWEGCSNFSVPLTMLGVETLKPRLTESVLGSDPIVYAVPTESYDDDTRERAELLVNWRLRSTMRIGSLVEESAHVFLMPGTVVAKIRWRVDMRRRKYVQTFANDTAVEQMFRDLYGPSQPELHQDGAGRWRGVLSSPTRPQRDTVVTFRAADDGIHALVEKDDVVYEGPWVDLVAPEDFFVPARGGGDVQRMPWVAQRLWWDEQELRAQAGLGVLDADAVDALLAAGDPSSENSQQDAVEIRQTRADTEGVSADAGSSVRDTQYEIYEDYRRVDIDDDGFVEDVVTWSCPQLPGRLLGWDYLDNAYAHGMRPFAVGRYLAQPGRFYGLSFPQVVRPIQQEVDTIHNWRVDAGMVQNTPGYIFRASSTHVAGGPPIAPGQGVSMDDPASVRPFAWNGSPVFGMNEESLLYQYFERLTGLTDLTLGRQTNRVGATRTATGVASLLSEAGLRFKTAMTAFQRFWADVASQVLALDQQYIPDGLEFRVTGRYPETIKVTDRSTIAGRYDLRLSATTETLNRQTLREDATVKLQAGLNPVAIQLGLIGAKGIYRLFRAYFQAYGETDPDLILEPPKKLIVMSPEQELAAWASGGSPEPSMLEDLGEHIRVHQMHLADAAVREQLGPDIVGKIEQHLAQTLQIAQMQMAAKMLQGPGAGGRPQVGEQAMNAQIGAAEGRGPGVPAGMGGGTNPGGPPGLPAG